MELGEGTPGMGVAGRYSTHWGGDLVSLPSFGLENVSVQSLASSKHSPSYYRNGEAVILLFYIGSCYNPQAYVSKNGSTSKAQATRPSWEGAKNTLCLGV